MARIEIDYRVVADLKTTRLWHFRRSAENRRFAEMPENETKKAEFIRRAEFHSRCVSAMDSLFPCDETVARDDLADKEKQARRMAR